MWNFYAPFFVTISHMNETHTFHYFKIEHKNLRIMDSYHEEDVNTMVKELEVAEEIEEEEQMLVEAILLDECSIERLRKLPSPWITESRSVNKSLCMDQMPLL